MKAIFSEEHYRQYWDWYLKPVPGEDYINLEKEMAQEMSAYNAVSLPPDVKSLLERTAAEKIADRCRALCLREKKTIEDIEAGRASFGMVTQQQEISARAEYVKRFWFNCLQLADFRKKYGIK